MDDRPVEWSWVLSVRASPAIRGLVKLVRWFLAVVFIVPGLEKLTGDIFRRALSEPGLFPFFQALHEVGPYWRFIGLCQVLAGALLLFRRTAVVGALACLPIYANIMVLLLALPFDAEDIIAGGILLLLNVALIAWYAPELRPLLCASAASEASFREAFKAAWQRAWFRVVVLVGVLSFVVVHLLSLFDVI